MRLFLSVFVACGALAAANAQPAPRAPYCDVPEAAARHGDDFLELLLDRCRPGDLVAVTTQKPDWVARMCDLSKPTTPAGPFVICQLAASVGPHRAATGARPSLRERAITPRPPAN